MKKIASIISFAAMLAISFNVIAATKEPKKKLDSKAKTVVEKVAPAKVKVEPKEIFVTENPPSSESIPAEVAKDETIAPTPQLPPITAIKEQKEMGACPTRCSSAIGGIFQKLIGSTSIAKAISAASAQPASLLNILMILVASALIIFSSIKNYLPKIFLPLAFGALLANIPAGGFAEAGGILKIIYDGAVLSGICPIIILMGIGATCDFGPMIAHPKAAAIGIASQIGIFITVIIATLIGGLILPKGALPPSLTTGLLAAANGPMAMITAIKLAPAILAPIAIAAYMYIALMPLWTKRLSKLLTNEYERQAPMNGHRLVTKRERITFSLIVLAVAIILIPSGIAIIAPLVLGNLLRESNSNCRIADLLRGHISEIAMLVMGLGLGAACVPATLFRMESLWILLIGLLAPVITASVAILTGKIMHRFGKNVTNPIIGIAAFANYPTAAQLASAEGTNHCPANHLLTNGLAVNASALIASAIAAGILIAAAC